jgi:high affinity Mn2+ porin
MTARILKRCCPEFLRDLLALVMVLAIHVPALRAQEAVPRTPSGAAPVDTPASSSSGWSGFYIGAYGGVAGGHAAWSAAQPSGPTNLSSSLDLFHAYDLRDGSGSQFGGLTAGFNFLRAAPILVGIEGDVSFTAEPAVNAALSSTSEVFGTARGRIGYASRHALYYATGGLAWTHDRLTRTNTSGSADDPLPETVTDGRIGWAVGGGVEAPVAAGWTARAEYLYAPFRTADVAFPLGPELTSDLSMHQLRVGLNYRPGRGSWLDNGILGLLPLDMENWSVHGQTTYLNQYAAPFHAPYSGANSLASNAGRETWDATLYLGRRLWNGAELWFNPEIDQGFGLSNTLGVAGFTSGEAYKVGFAHPYLRLPRAFVRQTVSLGGPSEPVEAGLNQFGGAHTANRLVVTAGKVSVSDLFDTITYAHDPRNDFMNWALVDAGTFDYAADAWSFTYGAAVEWYRANWAARLGLFDLSIVPNSVELDSHFGQYQIVYEVARRHLLKGQPGQLAAVGFVTRGRMGRYDDAVALAQQTGTAANTADVRRYASRPGVNVNLEQQLGADVGIFGRVGWASGEVEPFEFTDIDHTASAGLSLGGRRWARPHDTFGVAAVVSGITDAHRAYLNAGGLGILVGDGQLPHPGLEQIIETYYRLPVGGSWQVTLDCQFIVNPAFNRDRGPVSVVSGRLRAQF